MLVKWGVVAVAVAGFAGISMYLGPGEDDEPALPPELAAEPDVFIEQGTITRYRDDGALHYRLLAEEISHFDDPVRTVLLAPVVEMHDVNQPPWRIESRAGEVRTVSGPSGEDEEQVHLYGEVALLRDLGDGAFTRILTESLMIYPDRGQARAKQTAMIETDTVSARVGGFEADLANGHLAFYSTTDQRVSIFVEPDQQTPPRR